MDRKIKNKKKKLLVASGIILLMLVLAVICWHWLTPVKIGSSYHLGELEEDQAVLVVRDYAIWEQMIVVDSCGKWKYFSEDEMGRGWLAQFNNDLYWGRITWADVYDEIIKSKDIPYRKGRVSKRLLDWAINIDPKGVEKVQEQYSHALDASISSFDPGIIESKGYRYYAIIRTGEQREEVLIETLGPSVQYPEEESLTCYTGDVRLRMMRRRLEKLQKKCDMHFD